SLSDSRQKPSGPTPIRAAACIISLQGVIRPPPQRPSPPPPPPRADQPARSPVPPPAQPRPRRATAPPGPPSDRAPTASASAPPAPPSRPRPAPSRSRPRRPASGTASAPPPLASRPPRPARRSPSQRLETDLARAGQAQRKTGLALMLARIFQRSDQERSLQHAEIRHDQPPRLRRLLKEGLADQGVRGRVAENPLPRHRRRLHARPRQQFAPPSSAVAVGRVHRPGVQRDRPRPQSRHRCEGAARALDLQQDVLAPLRAHLRFPPSRLSAASPPTPASCPGCGTGP